MANEYKTKPLTLETLEKYNKEVLLPDIKEVVSERMRHYTDKVLKSNDKVIKELKPLREEQKAIDQNYKQLDKRVDTLEDFAEETADVAGVKFERVNPWPRSCDPLASIYAGLFIFSALTLTH